MLATIRKIKNMTPQETKKSLVQSLVLSKLNFNDSVTDPLSAYLQKRVQRVQNAGAPNENIVENHLNITLLNVFDYLNVKYRHIFIP